jgi:DNA-binding Lrp family transcriptional regulator
MFLFGTKYITPFVKSKMQAIISNKKNKKKLDNTDLSILRLLTKNADLSASEISKLLRRKKIIMTDRGVRKRIKSMEKHEIIKGYTILINDDISGKAIRTIVLVKFKNIPNFKKRIEEYNDYVLKSPYCIFVIKLRTDYDWMHYKCFPNMELAEEEDIVFRSNFGDLMNEYRSYDAAVIKNDLNAFLDTKEIEEYLQKISIN